jgi:hypothetical protein
LWDWDSAEADNFIVGGTSAGNGGTGGPANGGPTGFGSSGAAPVLTNAQYNDTGVANAKVSGEAEGGDQRRPPSAQTGATAATSTGGTGYAFSGTGGTNQTRAGTAGSTLPPTSTGPTKSWGFPGSAKPPDAYGVAGGAAPDPLFETGKGVTQGAGQPRARPHTAGGVARAPADGEEDDDGHVVAGARAMMRYRRTKTDGPTEGQPRAAAAGGSAAYPPAGRSGGWGSGSGTGSGAPAIGKDGKSGAHTSMFKGGNASSTPNLGTDAVGRPKSASATGTSGGMPVTRSSSALNNSDPYGRSGGAGAGGVAAGAASNSSNGSNSLSYGALKNRFLSGSKNKSKLFTLGSR